MPSVVSPLQLTAIASMLQNLGLNSVPSALPTAINTFNATTAVTNFAASLNFYKAQPWATSTTLDLLLAVGSTTCPALGNSIPASPIGTYSYLLSLYLPSSNSSIDQQGFSNLISQTAYDYLGDGDYGKFSTGFTAVQNYIATTNNYINSSVNANQYLGPTFSTMDDLVTAGIASMSTDLTNLGVDLTKQGNLWNMNKLDLYGTPAGLLQQISSLAGLRGQTVPDLQSALISVGMTDIDIANLVNDNRAGLNRPTGLSQNDFDRLQLLAYYALTLVSGDALQQILDILEVTTPDIDSLDDLLNAVKTFPLSYPSLQTPSPAGPILIFSPTGSVNSGITPIVNSYLPTASGCDELGKIIPPAQATANKAIQVSFQQINGIPNTSLPRLADTIVGSVDNPWTVTQPYLANAVVANGDPVSTYYRAIQDVPAGIDINNTTYWTPTTLGGINTMAGLPLIQAQTTAVDSSVPTYFSTDVATGTGPDGTITTYDVLGLVLDSNNFAAQLNTATSAINSLQTAGSLATLNAAYTNILSAATDAAVLTQITNANAAIAALSASPYVATLNTAWVYMANLMNLSAKYTLQAGVDYFNLPANNTISTYAFVQNLPQYGLLTADGDAAEFLNNLVDTATLGGQAIVGVMREGQNTAVLNPARLYNANQIPGNPEIAPIPVVVPVN
jgi:hypothetical protein